MLRYALRRVLWSIPTLLATSLFLFLVVTTLAPDPVRRESGGPVDAASERIEEAHRSQFFDLPRFVNYDPRDVR
jgi:peptide/nickel transport system permease protein